ncbi:MAG: FHA domain-containing protein [Solirubrobacterales bacterium]|nr:FHA domain-containing protein [Solirubrobacterales bacterium]MCO5327562.1 FHA domain-containing protein [Solirubrobacterales bacterium]
MTGASHDWTPTELAALLAAEREGGPFLLLRDGDGQQRLLELTGERLTVGREEGSDLALTWDAEVSRLHALLEHLGGSWTVVDDGLSRNGTLVNGVRVHGRRRLGDRDVIRFGVTEATFRDPAKGAEETAAAAGDPALAAVTPAQRRVLVALCRPLAEPDGHGVPPSNAEVAASLAVSVEAVRSHMKTLFRIFEVPDLPQNRKRAELARRALAAGVILPRDL